MYEFHRPGALPRMSHAVDREEMYDPHTASAQCIPDHISLSRSRPGEVVCSDLLGGEKQ